MSGIDLAPGIDDSNEWLSKIRIGKTQRAKQGPVGGPGISLDDQITSLIHFLSFRKGKSTTAHKRLLQDTTARQNRNQKYISRRARRERRVKYVIFK
jgi:hypothetical protein